MPSTRSPHLVTTGDRFTRLTVLGYSHNDKRHRRFYHVRCDCGVEKTVQGIQLRSGNTRSCGCLSLERKRATRLPDNHGEITAILLSYKRHAKTRGIQFRLTREEVSSLVRKPCFYCDNPAGNLKKTKDCPEGFRYNGIDRCDSNGIYEKNNVVPCCGVCNTAKLDRSQEDFIAWVLKAAKHLKEKS